MNCYRCGSELTVFQMLKIKEPHKRPHNEPFCFKCADIERESRNKSKTTIKESNGQ